METDDRSVFFVPDYHEIERDSLNLFVDYNTPNWIVTDKRGSQIINNIKKSMNKRELLCSYASQFDVDTTKAWMDIDSFLDDLYRSRFVSSEPITRHDYDGRVKHIPVDKLSELWIHTNNNCNLSCDHCLVDSSPDDDKGLSTEQIKDVIDSAIKLGTTRFYFTGGEPFMRPDIFELIKYICDDNKKELIVLTNATLLKEKVLEKLKEANKEYLRIQISLDGSTPAVNDSVRGKGSFKRTVEGIKNVVAIGFDPTVTTAVTGYNINDVSNVTKLLQTLGVKTHHLLWVHKRGRAANNDNGLFVSSEKLIELTKSVKVIARELGIKVDNMDSYQFRANSTSGTRYDLGNACYDSLCVFSNGDIYPSAAFAGHEKLTCGNVLENSLEDVWRNSNVTKAFRNSTMQNKKECSICSLKFICGGGDIEHSFFYSPNGFKMDDCTFPKKYGCACNGPVLRTS